MSDVLESVVPGQLSKACSDNAERYRSPQERNMKFLEINIPTSDGCQLHGSASCFNILGGCCYRRIQEKQSRSYTFTETQAVSPEHRTSSLDIGYRMDRLAMFYFRSHVNVLIIDYRGYGSSTGTPTERGLELDAEAVLNYALHCDHIASHKLVLFGKSLGGAVAAYLAVQQSNQILAVILENTFTNMAQMVDEHMPWARFVKGLVLRNYWPTIERIKIITRPILFIYGERDEIINNQSTVRLHAAATAAVYKEIHMMPNGDHNTCYQNQPDAYIAIIARFLERVVAQHVLIE